MSTHQSPLTTLAASSAGESPTLAPRPRGLFMTLRDLGFWMRSASADLALRKLRRSREPQAAFDGLYAQRSDPWGATLPCYRYQRQKYETLLSLLPNRTYEHTLDVGCGLGVFTRMLAPYTRNALGVDLSQTAVEQARSLSEGFPNLRFQQGDVLHLETLPSHRFDLIVLADVLYYLEPLSSAVLASVHCQVATLLAPGGILLLANHCFFGWDADSRSTQRIRDSFCAAPSLPLLHEQWRPFYLGSVFQKRP